MQRALWITGPVAASSSEWLTWRRLLVQAAFQVRTLDDLPCPSAGIPRKVLLNTAFRMNVALSRVICWRCRFCLTNTKLPKISSFIFELPRLVTHSLIFSRKL